MQVIYEIGKIKSSYRKAIVAIGVFDGVHRGHQKLIKKIVQRARKIHGTSIVITFNPHPVHVLRPEINLPLVVSFEHRLKLIEQLGVDVCIVVNFTKKFAAQSPEVFVKKYFVSKIKPSEIYVGDDFRFGQNREGDTDLFKRLGKENGFIAHTIHAVKKGNQSISSTRIRNLIALGKLKDAARLLSRRVSVLGKVVRGKLRGRKIGYPTANIEYSQQVIPPVGVYMTRVEIDSKSYFGMANIGVRPTFERNNKKITIEVHILDFQKNIYSNVILVEFLRKIRNEKFFINTASLLRQIRQDELRVRRLVKS